MNEKQEIMRNETARETPEHVIGRFVMCIAHDLATKDPHDAAIWPEWSEDTKAWWTEIEQRMTTPACLNFDWEVAKKEIREEVEKEDHYIKNTRDYQTSWRVGIKDGLWKAYNIMARHVRVME